MTDESKAHRHVLVIEDEPDFAALLQSILVQAGYSVTTAHGCEDALSQVRSTRPDVITLDVGMPRKSGTFFYRKLKTDITFRKCRNIPVVFVTGLMRDPEMDRIIRSLVEADDVPHPEAYVDKPIDKTHFLKAVEEALLSSTS